MCRLGAASIKASYKSSELWRENLSPAFVTFVAGKRGAWLNLMNKYGTGNGMDRLEVQRSNAHF